MSTKSQFYIIRENRNSFIRLVKGLTMEQINTIPTGFRNNIAWNFCHIVVSQQVLCYIRAGQSLKIDRDYIEKYQRGTVPDSWISQDEIAFFIDRAIPLIDEMAVDWNAGRLAAYQPFTTSVGVAINTAQDALHYVSAHDAMHLGYAMALRKMVTSGTTINTNNQ